MVIGVFLNFSVPFFISLLIWWRADQELHFYADAKKEEKHAFNVMMVIQALQFLIILLLIFASCGQK